MYLPYLPKPGRIIALSRFVVSLRKLSKDHKHATLSFIYEELADMQRKNMKYHLCSVACQGAGKTWCKMSIVYKIYNVFDYIS